MIAVHCRLFLWVNLELLLFNIGKHCSTNRENCMPELFRLVLLVDEAENEKGPGNGDLPESTRLTKASLIFDSIRHQTFMLMKSVIYNTLKE